MKPLQLLRRHIGKLDDHNERSKDGNRVGNYHKEIQLKELRILRLKWILCTIVVFKTKMLSKRNCVCVVCVPYITPSEPQGSMDRNIIK